MHAPRRLGWLAATAALAGACGHAGSGPVPAQAPVPALPASPPTSAAPTPFQHGRASYYADSLAGRATASGERYDPRALTAAHRTLPFGTWVDVVRPDGRRVRVRVNDRGPFKAGRVIDLSRAAAEALGMVSAGVVEVELYRVP
ncbi:MAG: septal ring lytic transglycosylase RlpA family protein [Polyangiaceae bacterium]|nr:septal ring lytic transglycosylase RlpA family protein [Polyangiaceae bacterium]